MRIIKIVVLATLGVFVNAPTYAQYYGGLPLSDKRGTSVPDTGNLLFGSRFFAAADESANGDTDLKFGYRFSPNLMPHLALIWQYANSSRWNGQKTLFGGLQTAPKTTSYGLDLVSTLPIFERLSLTGSAGLARVQADSVFGSAAPFGLHSNNDGRTTSAGRAGLLVQYDFNRSLGFRFGVERYRNLNGSAYAGSNIDADTFSFGLRIRF